MILRYKLFNLPIYRRSYDKYDQDAKKDIEKNMKILESSWNKCYKSIPEHIRIEEENRYEWPPWEFNDIIGFVDIGMDSHDRLTGDIFLMRQFLPKNHPKNRYRKYHSTLEKRQVYFFRELTPHKVEWHNNHSYIIGINQLIEEATNITKGLSKTKKHKWVLQKISFSLDCIDFVKVASDIHPNFPNNDFI